MALSHAWPAWAGRPLSSDDAATASAGTCQIEAWAERSQGVRSMVLAPACGVAAGLEIGADITQAVPRAGSDRAGGLALKWAPETWVAHTLAGDVNFGLKLSAAYAQPEAAGWGRTQTTLLGLASLKAHDTLNVHANLGQARDRASGSSATLSHLAFEWSPTEQGLLFYETQTNTRRAVFGGTAHTTGGRWWLSKDRLGLDLTTRRADGVSTWTLGLGWYGLAF